MPNIIQAEFFHVGGLDAPHLDVLIGECKTRIADGARIKTTVRFYDTDGSITSKAVSVSREDERLRKMVAGYTKANGWKRVFIGTVCIFALKKRIRSREQNGKVLSYIQLKLLETLRTSGQICVERHDRSFRPMRKDEAYDLATAIAKAKNVWIFVFSPNELCADKNTLIAQVM